MLEHRLPRAEASQILPANGLGPARSWIWNVPSFEEHMERTYARSKASHDAQPPAAPNALDLEELMISDDLQKMRGACRVLTALIGAAVVALPVSTVAAFFGYSILSSLLIYCGVSLTMFVLLMFLMARID